MPFWIKLLGLVIWIPFLILYILALPFIGLYGLLLCVLSWFLFLPKGKDVLLIQNDSQNPGEYFPQLMEVTAGRATILTFAERKKWPRWSLSTLLFWQFGPIGMPVHFTSHNLPAVVFLRKFRFPQKFAFGQMSKDREAKLEQLTAMLHEPRT